MTDPTPEPYWPPHAARRHVQEPAPDEQEMTYEQVREFVRGEFAHDIEHLGSKVERLRTRAFEAEARENFLRTRAERAESNARGKQAVIEAKRATLDRVQALAAEWEGYGHGTYNVHPDVAVANDCGACAIVRALRAILDAPQPEAGLTEQGRRLASKRDDLIASGADPAALAVPLAPQPEAGGDDE